MNRGLWIARKNHLFCLIRKVSIGYGGDEEEWLKQHFLEVLAAHPDEKIEEAITCYEEMITQIPFYPWKIG